MLAIVHARKLAGNGEDEQTEQKERHVQKKEIHNSGDNNILSERVRSSSFMQPPSVGDPRRVRLATGRIELTASAPCHSFNAFD